MSTSLRHSLRPTLETLLESRSLSESQAEALLHELTEPTLSPAMASGILIALRMKGVTAAELRGFARGMRALALRPQLPDVGPTVDVVGTGGDASHSFNLSTGAALLAVACGAKVTKHGNRSVSSSSGSADLLEALGLKLPLDQAQAGACLAKTGFTFLYAPHYHPAMRSIAPVRAALGVRTFFNILGPLTNPAQPPYQLIGAYSLPTAQLMAEALAGLATRRSFVVHGELGWDEPTPVSPFVLLDVKDGKVSQTRRTAADYEMAVCSAESLRGGNAQTNAHALLQVFLNEDRGPHRDALLMGASLVLELTGVVDSPLAGVAVAASALEDGRAALLLNELRTFGGSVGV